jgi:NagD protein
MRATHNAPADPEGGNRKIVIPSFGAWFDQHQDEFDAVVLDIDGVLLLAGAAPSGGRELIEKLRRKNFPFSLLTNDGNHSIEEKCQYLKECGIEIAAEEVTSCGHGLVEIANKFDLAGKLFFVMGELGDPCYAENAGLVVTRNTEELPKCAGIITGEENYDWEPVINAAVNYFIANPKAPLVVPNPDEYFPAPNGKIKLAAGATARFIQRALKVYGTIIEPIYLGKPYAPIFEHSHSVLQNRLKRSVELKRVIMIGDSIDSDIRGANDFGYRSALVLTGVTRLEMLKAGPVQPDFIFERL